MIDEKKKMTTQDSSVGADDGQSISKNSDIRIACWICVWIATRIACQILKLAKRTLCRCGKSTEI